MDYALLRGGLLVHSRKDWPCAVCRPEGTSGRPGHCLCLQCARTAMAAAGVGLEGARDLLDDITDALVLLEPQMHVKELLVN